MSGIKKILLTALILTLGSKTHAVSLKLIGTFPHQESSYTQGLFYYNDFLYESIGLYGQSEFRKLDANTGKVVQKYVFPRMYFAEGACEHGGLIYVLTWNEQTCFVLHPNTLKLVAQLPYSGEAWGLCSDGKYLIMSDGSSQLTFRNAGDMNVVRNIQVRYRGKQLSQLNELEYINGEIWANVYMTDWIVRINPKTGVVIERMDFSTKINHAQRGSNAEVMNGIAWNAKKKEILIGGKLWKNFFKYVLTP